MVRPLPHGRSVVEKIAGDYEGKAVVGKVDVDSNQEISMKFGVRSIPTIVFIKNGEVVDKSVAPSRECPHREAREADGLRPFTMTLETPRPQRGVFVRYL